LQSPISPQYLASTEHLALLNQHQLASFEQLWAYQGEWFEPPNRERGGWSGVNLIELTTDAGKKVAFYLKRQQNFMRRTWRHPIMGEPTFVREFKMMQYLTRHQIAIPQIVFFASKQAQALLLTEALEDYVSFDRWLENNSTASLNKKRTLLHALAQTIRSLHQARVQYRSLYAKHLFIKDNADNFDIALIDFEKSRISTFIPILKFSDLITFNYRTPNLSRTQRLYFFKQYLKISRLSAWHKCLCRYINKKSLRKMK
jgi:tRNA A-37 threonylcarbamoyl transferase component Bud32